MDKTVSEFESYEYFPSSNVEAESDQFFVVQDDGTFLISRQVQYVAEVKEAIDSATTCTVYDVNPRQFFVDVTDNPAELISVPDNYVLPSPATEEANNIYGNSFLLQTVTPPTTQQTTKELEDVDQFKTTDEQVFNVEKQEGDNCTEITLSDEQYKLLEQKGWVLLEACGKIYLLDTFGLHDITSNQELIQNLKAESQVENIENTAPRLYEDTGPTLKLELKDVENIINKREDEYNEFDVGRIQENGEEISQINVIDEEEENSTKQENANETAEDNILEDKHTSDKEPLQEYNVDKIKIVTKCIFKDIPDKVVLGKTANGKRLVARVVKKTCGPKIESSRMPDTEPISFPRRTTIEDYDAECKKVFKMALCGEIESTPEDAAAANMVIHQLSQVADVRASIDGRNVIITKLVEKIVDGVTSFERSFVTGFVTSVQGSPKFVHVPSLLEKLVWETEESSNRSLLKCQQRPADHKILQVHVSETRRGHAETVSVLLNEQVLPSMAGGVTKRLSKLHACSSCAAVFVSEKELADHRENHALDAEDTLTIDTARLPKDSHGFTENSYFTVKTERGTEYGCLQCPKKFTKLIKCLRHKKIHQRPKKQDSDKEGELQIDMADAPFKCNMCSSQYNYAASLSKHICKAHITKRVRKVAAPYLISWQQ